MMNSSFSGFIAYFKDWVSNDPEMRFFMFADVQRGMDHAQSHADFEYPFMWLEEPEIQARNNGSQHWDEYNVGVNFITECKADLSQDEVVKALDLAFSLCGRFEKKFWADEVDGLFLNVNEVKTKQIIDPLFLLNATGWRLELAFAINSNMYLHDS
ncbi:hypothetical protein LAG90_15570 [Marinilongibacter aquaticus]|uniref:hypothetical protein n=1 Tax=Marinilongibacter aquaticus TaxID=2975157 RepID=UPI0021BD7AA6|nr:hypothetical protein [Marinilongibacter aquaticus]UBM58222.1 hypothetical protein LAG90_15570 [Marinilongibacter aquaticus]